MSLALTKTIAASKYEVGYQRVFFKLTKATNMYLLRVIN